MHIARARIKNFRGLEDIEFSPSPGVNILVGPNAVGKTSVLEAIRLAKSFLAPRYREELSQVLISLGAATQHLLFGESQLDFTALVGVPNAPLDVTLEIELSSGELSTLDSSRLSLAQVMVRSRIGQERASSQLDLIQYMSSPEGRAQLQAAVGDIQKYVDGVRTSRKLSLTLTMLPVEQSLQISSRDTTAQIVVQALESACSPSAALVSYFPADRALPSGEVNIQLGSADMQQQVFSHLAQPAGKYNRLKQIIVNSFVLGVDSRKDLEDSFNAIFGELLPGKKLEAIQQKPTGNLTVLIRDLKLDRVFDIDSMSSGEKGLILTFLLLRKCIAPGGIVLLDEPELHLNPAVCGRLVPFLQSRIIGPLSLQAFICTHSAEILSSALHGNDCSIFHLRTGRDITPVNRSDKAELFEILKRLGLTSMDVVSWQGTIFVEGDEDIDLLSAGFPDLMSGYQLKQLGGRAGIERDIQRLQDAEARGDLQRLSVFIFDQDSRPTSLGSTARVRIIQWDRYSIESYLLDENLLFPVLNRYAEYPVESKGALRNLLRDLALEQLSDEVVRRVYSELEPENCGLRSKEVASKPFAESANLLFDRIERARQAISSLDRSPWVEMFIGRCSKLERELREDWDTNWRQRCNSKRLFRDLQARQKLKTSMASMKVEMMREMRLAKNEDWRVIESLLVQATKLN